MSDDCESNKDYETLNEHRQKLHEIQMRSSEKIEGIITQISAIFIGAIGSFYAIIKSPIIGCTAFALMAFISCIIINCVSYSISFWSMHFGILGDDPNHTSAKCYESISETLSRIIVWLDQISLLVFIIAIITGSIGTYTGYTKHIENEKINNVRNVSTTSVPPINTNNLNSIQPLPLKNAEKPSMKNTAEPAGYSLPPKVIKPPPKNKNKKESLNVENR